MKPVVIIMTVVLLLGTLSLRAQQSPPSNASVLDSLVKLSETQFAFDSLKLNIWSDSIKSRIGVLHTLDSLDLVSKIDSLRNLDLPALPFQQKLDSLLAKRDALILEVENKKQEVLTQTKGRLETWRDKVTRKLESLFARKERVDSGSRRQKLELLSQSKGKLETWRNAASEKLGLDKVSPPDLRSPFLIPSSIAPDSMRKHLPLIRHPDSTVYRPMVSEFEVNERPI